MIDEVVFQTAVCEMYCDCQADVSDTTFTVVEFSLLPADARAALRVGFSSQRKTNAI